MTDGRRAALATARDSVEDRAKGAQAHCYTTHPFVVPATAICPDCLRRALREAEAATWEAAARILQRGSDEPMTGTDETVQIGQAGVKIALGLLAIEFRCRAALTPAGPTREKLGASQGSEREERG